MRKTYVIYENGEIVTAGSKKKVADALGVDAGVLDRIMAGKVEMNDGFKMRVFEPGEYVNLPVKVEFSIDRDLFCSDDTSGFKAVWVCPNCSALHRKRINLADFARELAVGCPRDYCRVCDKNVWLCEKTHCESREDECISTK